jgi:hypothetical protein
MVRSFVFASALVLALVGCKSSSTTSSTSGTTTATSTTTATGAGGGSTTTTMGAGGAGEGGQGAGGGAAAGACTNDADKTIIEGDKAGLQKKVGDCATKYLGQDGPTNDCIKEQTGLSADCSKCFGDEVSCAVKNCMNECLADQQSQACTDCRAKNCDPAFETCAGLSAN